MKGQVLTSLLIIMFVGMTVTTAAVALIDTNLTSTVSLQNSNEALALAESGIEDSLIKLLRNPSFIGETLTVGDGTATITVTPGSPIIMTAQGSVASHLHTIQVTVSFINGVMKVTSWNEI